MKNTSPSQKSSDSSELSRRRVKKITENFLENAGKSYLERFPASVSRFRQVMTRKIQRSCRAHPGQDRDSCLALLEKIIERFQRAGLLDDAAFSRGLSSSLERRGFSSRRIFQRLERDGLSQDLVTECLHDLSETHDLLCAAALLRRKKLGPCAQEKGGEGGKRKEEARALAALARAGFGFDTAREALAMTAEDIDALLHGQEKGS